MLDTFNKALRASPTYQNFMTRRGLPTDGRVRLSRAQQADLERAIAATGTAMPAGMHVDQGGNLNQKNTTVRNVGIGAAATGAALTGFGLAGMGPLAGMGGGAAAGSGAIAGGSPWAVTPLAGTAGMSGTGATGMGVGSSVGNLLKSFLTNGGVGDIASVLGSAGQQAGNQRFGENNQALDLNRAKASVYGTQQNALLNALLAKESGGMDRYRAQQGATQTALGQQSNEGLQRAQLGLQAPSTRARQSVLGSLMKNMQDVNIQGPASQQGHVPTITGGMRPSNLDPTTRGHGEALMQAALQAQLTGSDVPAATDFKSGVLTAPGETDFQSGLIDPPDMGAGLQGEGGLEKTLGGGGVIASILAALAKQNKGRQPAYDPREMNGGG